MPRSTIYKKPCYLREIVQYKRAHPQNPRTVYASFIDPKRLGQSSELEMPIPTAKALRKSKLILKPMNGKIPIAKQLRHCRKYPWLPSPPADAPGVNKGLESRYAFNTSTRNIHQRIRRSRCLTNDLRLTDCCFLMFGTLEIDR